MSKYRGLDNLNNLKNREYIYNYNIKTSLINSTFLRANAFYCKNLFAHYGCVNALEFSNDGEWFASGGDDRRVLLWNVEKNIVSDNCNPAVMSGRHASNIFCLAFDSLNSKIFSAGNDEQVIIHDAKTGALLDVFPHYEAIYSLAIDPLNDNVFATACDDEVLIWDTRQSSESTVLACCNSSFHAVVYNPVDTRILATANSNGGIGLWDVRQPCSPLFKFSDCSPCQSSMSVRFSANGRFILSLRRRLPVGLFTLTSPYPIFEFDHPGYYNSCTMKSCCFAGENDEYIMSGSDDFNLYMWRIPDTLDSDGTTTWVNEAHTIFKGHRSIVNQVRYNSSRSIIASSGVEKIIKLWSPFPMPSFELQPPNEPRQIFVQDDYINMVMETGQYVTHDYSMQSTAEDPRMMAFFDSMVQRDVEGWSSHSTSSSFYRLSQDSLGEFSTSSCSSGEDDEEDLKSFAYLSQLAKRVGERLDTAPQPPATELPAKERIFNLIAKKKHQQELKSTLLSYKSSKRRYKANRKKMGRDKYHALQSAKKICLMYREKFFKSSRSKMRYFLLRRMDRAYANSATVRVDPNPRSLLERVGYLRDILDSPHNSQDSSSSSSSAHSWTTSSHRRTGIRSPSSNSSSLRRISKKPSSGRNYRSRETSNHRRPLSQMSESDTDIEHDLMACNNNNNGASKAISLKKKFWGPIKKTLRRRRNGERLKTKRPSPTHNGSSSDSSCEEGLDRIQDGGLDAPSTSRQDTRPRSKRRPSSSSSSSTTSPNGRFHRTESNLVRVKRFRNLRADTSSSD